MVPASFDEANTVLGKPSDMTADDCEALSVLRTETVSGLPVVVSCWKLTQKELEEINRTGRVWLLVYGQTMPPVALDGSKPF
jgi:hypothetical protein